MPGVTSIDTILGQCTYFGLSFGRVGVDFTGRMSDVFIRVVGERFEQNVRRTTRKFEKDMETFTLINKTQRLDVRTETCINSVSIKNCIFKVYTDLQLQLDFIGKSARTTGRILSSSRILQWDNSSI